MMGLMIIPEFQIFGELLPLNQLSGTTVGYLLVTCSGFPGRGTIIGGAMAPLAPPLSTSLINHIDLKKICKKNHMRWVFLKHST